jgi:hypothetical protein
MYHTSDPVDVLASRFFLRDTSPRAFGLGFLQTPPHDDALALLLTFGSANTWYEDFHLASSVPCPAHTRRLRGGGHNVAAILLQPVRLRSSIISPLGYME